MNWFWLALLSTTLWSLTTFLDKYLVNRFFQKRGMTVLIFFGAVIGLLLLPVILLIRRNVLEIPLHDIFILIASGIVYVFAILPYFIVLRKEDPSTAAPFFQAIPVFSFFLGLIFLHEVLTFNQIAGGLLIIFGTVGIAVEFKRARQRIRWRSFLLLMLSVFLYALNIFLFKFIETASDFWTTSFWEYSGFGLVALAMLAIKKYRSDIWAFLKANGRRIVGVSALNEAMNIAAKIIFNYASLFAPLALVWVVGSAQPFVVLVLGAVLTLFLPKIFKEDISQKTLAQKFVFIAVILIGAFIINR
ncbi:MAG: DMT family transporter [Patescibacteria group bacterium]|nr:DMT family transporter [Patescibacteria group bacterium]